MKRHLFLFIVTVLVLLFCGISYAAPAYGPHMPDRRHWTWGLEVNSIIDRNLDNDVGSTSGDRFFVTGSYGIFSWLSFDGKIGIGDVEWDRNGADNLGYNANFAGAYGFRIKGYENKERGIRGVVGFQHISVHPDAKNQGDTKHEAIVDEWHGSAVISKEIGNFVPYVGGRYGTLDFIKWENEAHRKRIHSEEYFGVIIGLDYLLNDRTRLNLEGIFLDGQEIAFGISHDF